MRELRQNVPTFLVYIELFGIKENIRKESAAHFSRIISIGGYSRDSLQKLSMPGGANPTIAS
jgi:hypothetical protein